MTGDGRQATGDGRLVDDAWRGSASFLHWAGTFGSVARGEATAASDLDVAMIIEDQAHVELVKDRTIDTTEEFEHRFGRRLSMVVLSVAQFRKLFAVNDSSLAHELIRDGRRLAGGVKLEALAHGTSSEPQGR